MGSSPSEESFRELLLRYRGRSNLTQRQLAERVGVHRRSVQEWELGANYPGTDRLEALIRVLLDARCLTPGQEAAEVQALWSAVERDSARRHEPLGTVRLARLLGEHDTAPAIGAVGQRRQDWGDAPGNHDFVGRIDELQRLRSSVLDEQCRVIAVLAVGGVGKTSLVSKLAHDVAATFDRVYWRSLRDALPLSDWLTGAIGFLASQESVLPVAESDRIAKLLQALREQRCLVVLDNFETLFEPNDEEGRYRQNLAGYGRLLTVLAEAAHRSCLVLTSREAPAELAALRGHAVREFALGGLRVDDVRALLGPKQLVGTPEQWAELSTRYAGNGLALKVVGERIRDLFDAELGPFLAEPAGRRVFGGIRRVLSDQVQRASPQEQQVLRVLAVEREPVPLTELLALCGPRLDRGEVLAAVEALRRRSLLERVEMGGTTGFTLQSVVLEYVTDRLVDAIANEIQFGQPTVILEYPLMEARAADFVRQTQERLIGEAVLRQLKTSGAAGPEERLLALLGRLRERSEADQGYGPGNVINLLRILRGNLRGLDLSRLSIRQAYLARVGAQDASLVDARLLESILAEAFDFPGSLALSRDGVLLAAGTSTGKVHLWRVADRTPVLLLHGHIGGVRGVALSNDGHLLASGGADGTVRLWDTESGAMLAMLETRTGAVLSVSLSADGRLLASGGTDETVRVWSTSTREQVANLATGGSVASLTLSPDGDLLASGAPDGNVQLWETRPGRLLATMRGHEGGVRRVALSDDGSLVASSSEDATARIWDARTGQLLHSLRGHSGGVFGLGLSADGRVLASGGGDGTVRLWDTKSGHLSATLHGHTGIVWNVVFSADSRVLASSGGDATVRVWNGASGRPVATLQGHTGAIRGVALSPDGALLASGVADGTVQLWETASGRTLRILEGHAGIVWSVAMTGDGLLLACGCGDGTVQLWETRTGRPVATLTGHTGWVPAIALSADGHLLASGGGEGTVRLWDTRTGRTLAVLVEHTGTVWSVALSSGGELLASGSADGTVRLWQTSSGRLLSTLQAHPGGVLSVALTPDGQLLASGGGDGVARVWKTTNGRALAVLQADSAGVRGVALSGDGHLLATSGGEATVRLWDTSTGQPLATLQGHSGGIRGLAISAEGRLLASGSLDQTIRLWNTTTHGCVQTLRAERRYERLNITGLSGVSSAQHAALLALGAIEDRAMRVD